MDMTLVGQQKVAGNCNNEAVIGYEVFCRQQQCGKFRLPKNFSAIGCETLEALLSQTLCELGPTTHVLSFNLEADQFVDERYLVMTQRLQQQTPIELMVELTERQAAGVSVSALAKAAEKYQRCHLAVSLDDVGSGSNTPALAQTLDAFIAGYKFALQNFTRREGLLQLAWWYQRAQANAKRFAIEGLEDAEQVAQVRQDFPCEVLQGYYWGQAALMPGMNQQKPA